MQLNQSKGNLFFNEVAVETFTLDHVTVYFDDASTRIKIINYLTSSMSYGMRKQKLKSELFVLL